MTTRPKTVYSALMLFVLALPPAIAAAESPPTGAPTAAPSVIKGRDTALLFALGSLVSGPSVFDGIGIGARMRISPALVGRVGVGLSIVSATDKVDAPTGSSDEPSEDKSSATSFNVEGGLEYALVNIAALNVYTGGVVQLGIDKQTSEDVSAKLNSTTSGASITAAGLLGASWFPVPAVSLGAEYRFGLTYSSQTAESASTAPGGKSAPTRTTASTRVGVGSVGFILAFWW